MTSQTFLVAGGGGFIGGYVVADLLARGHAVRAVDRKPKDEWYQVFDDAESIVADLCDRPSCDNAVVGVDYVINLACDMGGMGFIENNKALCMRSVLVNTNLCDASRAEGVGRYFFASSACVYNGAKQDRPDVTALKEEDAYPAMPEDGYGWEKLFSERMCRHYREDFGLESHVARFHNVYGPNGTYDGGREKAPAAICRKVALAKLQGHKEIEIWGDGTQTRSFMYIDDCVTGFWKLDAVMYPEPINLGSAEMVSINQLVDLAEDIGGVSLRRSYKLDAPRGVAGRNSDNTLIRELTGWEPSIPLRDGLEHTYRWIFDQVAARA